MRIIFAIALLLAPAPVVAQSVDCTIISGHIEAMRNAHFDALYSGEAHAQAVKDAVNEVLSDPRMPSDLASEGRVRIFGEAFENWQTDYQRGRMNAQYPDDPAFDALMREKCKL